MSRDLRHLASAAEQGFDAVGHRDERRLSRFDISPVNDCRARLVRLAPGLYAIRVGPSSDAKYEVQGIPLPACQIAPAPGQAHVEVLSQLGESAAWLENTGGAAVVRVGGSTGTVVVTSFGERQGHSIAPAPIEILKLDEGLENVGSDAFRIDAPAPRMNAVLPAAPVPSHVRKEPNGAAPARTSPFLVRRPAALNDVPLSALLHIQRAGDRRLAAEPGSWIGDPSQRAWIEGLALLPSQVLQPSDLEYRTLGSGGKEGKWVQGGAYSGTRRQGRPVLGFALRLAGPARDIYEVSYGGFFLGARESGIFRDGELCRSEIANDPLLAVKIWISPRVR